MIEKLKEVIQKRLNAHRSMLNDYSGSLKEAYLVGRIDSYVDVLALIKQLEEDKEDG